MLTGIVILNVISYLPMFADFGGPYFQNPLFGDGFAPMYLLQTWQMIPVYAVFYWIAVKFYRQTGRIWLAVVVLATLSTWMAVTGTVQDLFVL